MKRYVCTLRHRPGHGLYDHLYEDFAATLRQELQPYYLRRRTLVDDLERCGREARAKTGFDGDWSYAITVTDV